MKNTFIHNAAVATVLLALTTTTHMATAGTATAAAPKTAVSGDTLASWWDGKYATGDWFGLRTTLADDYGLTFSGRYYGAFFGVVDGENGAKGFWMQGINFGAAHNIGKWLDIEELEGITVFGNFRWRDGRGDANPMPWIESTGHFMPSCWTSGVKFRVLSFGLELSSAKLLPVKDQLTLRGGWLQPQGEFLDQPHSRGFLMNSINSGKGLASIPFSSSASTWGGTLRVKPTDWSYAKVGLFMSFPKMTDSHNHGLAYRGYSPDTSKNGLWTMGELGVTPTIGTLPGKYAFGGYYFEYDHKTYTRQAKRGGHYGFYFQADQMLWTPETLESGKKPTKGLSTFNVLSFAPEEDNLIPFYFHTGLCYEGLIPSRDTDQLLFALSYGSYSRDKRTADTRDGKHGATYTIGMEGSYKANINKWFHVQPFVQYLVRPNGTSEVKNAAILGFQTGVTF